MKKLRHKKEEWHEPPLVDFEKILSSWSYLKKWWNALYPYLEMFLRWFDKDKNIKHLADRIMRKFNWQILSGEAIKQCVLFVNRWRHKTPEDENNYKKDKLKKYLHAIEVMKKIGGHIIVDDHNEKYYEKKYDNGLVIILHIDDAQTNTSIENIDTLSSVGYKLSFMYRPSTKDKTSKDIMDVFQSHKKTNKHT